MRSSSTWLVFVMVAVLVALFAGISPVWIGIAIFVFLVALAANTPVRPFKR